MHSDSSPDDHAGPPAGLPRRGLARRIYTAFLAAAVIPTAIAGLIGITVSLSTLRTQTLSHLQQEVSARASGVQLFFDQVAAELRFLSDMSSVRGLFDALAEGDERRHAQLAEAIERDFVRLAELHPHIYQMRLIDAAGQERVRVDKPARTAHAVAAERLQNKSDRYYVRDALARPRGELYVSGARSSRAGRWAPGRPGRPASKTCS